MLPPSKKESIVKKIGEHCFDNQVRRIQGIGMEILIILAIISVQSDFMMISSIRAPEVCSLSP